MLGARQTRFLNWQRSYGLLLVFFMAACLQGCASYTDEMAEATAAMRADRYADALEAVDSSAWSKDHESRLLYLMESGALLDKQKEHREARRRLLEADQLVDDLFTVSISKTAKSLVVSEDAKDYEGEDYEKVAIHTVLALSFIEQNNLASARVEARRINTRLNQINEQFDPDSNRYQEDAFARYLAGMIFEARGELDAAIVDYRAALKVYENAYRETYGTVPPKQLVSALMALAKRKGRSSLLGRLTKKYQAVATSLKPTSQKFGEVAVIHELGWIAQKEVGDFFFDTGKRLLRFSFPFIRPQYRSFGPTGIEVAGQTLKKAELVQNMDAIAIKALEDRKGRMLAKKAVRMVAKAGLTEAAEDRFGPLAGIVANAAFVALETADTRGWLSLPSRYMVTRLRLPAGPQSLKMYSDGKVVSVKKVNVRPRSLTLLRAY